MAKRKKTKAKKTKATSKKKKVAKKEVTVGELDEIIAVGYEPDVALSPQDGELFRAFQANLLSLISHELRTPLTGILGAVSMLEEQVQTRANEIPPGDLVGMAKDATMRLKNTLDMLLDVVAIESGHFHAVLREVDFKRIVRLQLRAQGKLIRGRQAMLHIKETDRSNPNAPKPLLGDATKLSRAVELFIQLMVDWPRETEDIYIELTPNQVSAQFEIQNDQVELWSHAWSQALAGFEGGVASATSAFGGTLQSERAFLTREKEGLGSEFMLIHEIMRLHRGQFSQSRSANKIHLSMELPELSSEEGLKQVISSRVYQSTMGLSSMALVLVEVPLGENIEDYRQRLKRSLFRSTDAAYELKHKKLVALVIDDIHPKDISVVIERIEQNMGQKLKYGVAGCPEDGMDAPNVIKMAEKRLAAT